jgi:dTMP kinase
MPGLLIALEGIDGSGLTTQAALLAQALRARGAPVYATKEPTEGPVGGLLRLALGRRLGSRPRDSDGAAGEAAFVPLDARVIALLFAADRLDHLAADVEPRLATGTTVVCDRYVLSSLAYQALDVDVEWLRAINTRARPADLTLFLDVPPETAIERVARRGGHAEIYERLETLRRIRANYLARLDDLRMSGSRVAVVAGTGSREEITAALVRCVQEAQQEATQEPEQKAGEGGNHR